MISLTIDRANEVLGCPLANHKPQVNRALRSVVAIASASGLLVTDFSGSENLPAPQSHLTKLCIEFPDEANPPANAHPAHAHFLPLADRLVLDKQYESAEELYRGVLEQFPTAQCAVRGLTRITEDRSAAVPTDSFMEVTSKRWDALYDDWLKPATNVLLPCLALLVVLLVLARLGTPLVVNPKSIAWGEKQTNTAWWTGLILLTLAALWPFFASSLEDVAAPVSAILALIFLFVGPALLWWPQSITNLVARDGPSTAQDDSSGVEVVPGSVEIEVAALRLTPATPW